MSEYSMMTQGIPWPVSYAAFTIGLFIVGWLTFVGLRYAELRKSRISLSTSRKTQNE
jgi:magnesium transporter